MIIDGDPLEFSIVSGNPNTNGDDTAALTINEEGQLSVDDREDLNFSDDGNLPLTLTVEATEANRDAESALSDVATVTLNSQPTNNPPELQFPLQDQTVSEGESFEFSFSEQAFNDTDADDTISYSASLADGSELPDWLSFDADTRNFSGTPGEEDDGTFEIEVTASDSEDETASTSFTLEVAEANDLSHDITGDGEIQSGFDGTLLFRYSLGLEGEDLTQGLPFDLLEDPTRTEASEIESYLENLEEAGALDITGDGEIQSGFDGALLFRYSLGLEGEDLTQGLPFDLLEDPTRTEPTEIESYLDNFSLA